MDNWSKFIVWLELIVLICTFIISIDKADKTIKRIARMHHSQKTY